MRGPGGIDERQVGSGPQIAFNERHAFDGCDFRCCVCDNDVLGQLGLAAVEVGDGHRDLVGAIITVGVTERLIGFGTTLVTEVPLETQGVLARINRQHIGGEHRSLVEGRGQSQSTDDGVEVGQHDGVGGATGCVTVSIDNGDLDSGVISVPVNQRVSQDRGGRVATEGTRQKRLERSIAPGRLERPALQRREIPPGGVVLGLRIGDRDGRGCRGPFVERLVDSDRHRRGDSDDVDQHRVCVLAFAVADGPGENVGAGCRIDMVQRVARGIQCLRMHIAAVAVVDRDQPVVVVAGIDNIERPGQLGMLADDCIGAEVQLRRHVEGGDAGPGLEDVTAVVGHRQHDLVTALDGRSEIDVGR